MGFDELLEISLQITKIPILAIKPGTDAYFWISTMNLRTKCSYELMFNRTPVAALQTTHFKLLSRVLYIVDKLGKYYG